MIGVLLLTVRHSKPLKVWAIVNPTCIILYHLFPACVQAMLICFPYSYCTNNPIGCGFQKARIVASPECLAQPRVCKKHGSPQDCSSQLLHAFFAET